MPYFQIQDLMDGRFVALFLFLFFTGMCVFVNVPSVRAFPCYLSRAEITNALRQLLAGSSRHRPSDAGKLALPSRRLRVHQHACKRPQGVYMKHRRAAPDYETDLYDNFDLSASVCPFRVLRTYWPKFHVVGICQVKPSFLASRTCSALFFSL